jgi:hypothetical protein
MAFDKKLSVVNGGEIDLYLTCRKDTENALKPM